MDRSPRLVVRSIAVILTAALLITTPGIGSYQAAAQVFRAPASSGRNTAAGKPLRVGIKIGPANVLKATGLRAVSLQAILPLTNQVSVDHSVPAAIPAATVRHRGRSPAVPRPIEKGVGTAVELPVSDAIPVADSKLPIGPKTVAESQPVTKTPIVSGQLSALGKKSSKLTQKNSRLSDTQLKIEADFTLTGKSLGSDTVSVSPKSRGFGTLGKTGLASSEVLGKTSVPSAPKVSGYKTNARGQLLWAVASGAVASGALAAGLAWLGLETVVSIHPAFFTTPVFALAAFSGMASLGYTLIGGRVAWSLWKKSKDSKLSHGGERAPPSFWSRLKSSLTTPIATPDSSHAALGNLPKRTQDAIDLHERVHRKSGLGEFAAYFVQGLSHPLYLAKEGAALITGVARLPGRIWNGVVSFGKMVRRMNGGDPELSHITKPYKGKMNKAKLLLVMDALLGMGLAFIAKPLLDIASSAGAGGFAAVQFPLIGLSIALVLTFAGYLYVELKHSYLSRVLGLWGARDYRVHLMRKFQSLEMNFHMENGSGALANRLKDDTGYLAGKNIDIPLSVAHYTIYGVLGMALMFYTSWPLALIVLSVSPFLGILIGLIGHKLMLIDFKIADVKAELLRHNQEAIENASTIKSFATNDVEVARYADQADKLKALGEKNAVLYAAYNLINKVSSFFSNYLIYILGAWALLGAPLLAAITGITFGTIIQFTILAGFVAYAFHGLSNIYLTFKRYHGATETIRGWLKRDPKIQDPENAEPLTGMRGDIVFENVDFAYKDGAETVLNDLSFRAKPGETVAFVGETGSGKSTIARVLIRLWENQKGRVMVDGRDIRDIKRSELLDQMAVVPQDARLFKETIRYNMLYGSEDASEEKLARAIKMAKADFVYDEKRFPEGLNTDVGEGGGRLSGGERQRVAIVRAFLRKPAILILDEATSALDNKSEKVVQTALDNLARGDQGWRPTTIVIAHRLTTIKGADNIFVLKNGHVAESGTHQELLAKKGIYHKLWSHGGDTKKLGQKTPAGDAPATQAAGQLAAGGLLAALSAALASSAWLFLVPIAGPLVLIPYLTLAAGTALAALAFAATGVRVALSVRKYLKAIEGQGPQGPPTKRSLRNYLLTSIATPLSRHLAFGNLPERYRAFIDTHEAAHKDRGVGEARAIISQIAVVPRLLGAELKAYAKGLKNFGGMVRNLVMGDEVSKPFMKKYRKTFALIITLLVLDALLWNATAYFLGALFDGAQTAADAAAAGKDTAPFLGPIWKMTILVPVLYAAATITQVVAGLKQALMKVRFVRDVRVALNEKILGREMDFHMKNESGTIATRISDDTEYFGEKIVDVRLPILNALIFFSLSTFLMLKTSLIMSLVVFAAMPILGVVNGYFGEKWEQIYDKFTVRRAELGRSAQEVLEQERTVKTFAREDYEVARYREKAQALVDIGEQDADVGAKSHVLGSSLTDFFTKYGLYIIGAWSIALMGGITLGQIASMTFYAGFVKGSFDSLTGAWLKYKQTHGATKVIRGWLEMESKLKDAPDAKPLPQVKGEVIFKDLTFDYGGEELTDASEPVLRNFTISIKPGEQVAFVGESGSGKSTVLRLLMRLWDPQRGSVTIDGHDIRDVTLESLNKQIAVVPQDTRLFNQSIRYNMLYGTEGVTEEELMAAIKAASAGFIFDKSAFPEGLETNVGEGGNRLSGGQRQRVAIVRAILKRPAILLLDEATSALDKKTEREVQATLDQLSSGKTGIGKPTTLVVAHNLTTIMNSDRIVVLDKGAIAEVGTHAELLKRGGKYKELWDVSLATVKQR